MLYYGMWKNKISKNHIFNKLQGKKKKEIKSTINIQGVKYV